MFRVSHIVKLNKSFVSNSSRVWLSGMSTEVVNHASNLNNRGVQDDILNQILFQVDGHYARLISLEKEHHFEKMSFLLKNKCSQQNEQVTSFPHPNTQDNAIPSHIEHCKQETDFRSAAQKVDVVPVSCNNPLFSPNNNSYYVSVTPKDFREQVENDNTVKFSLAKKFVQSLIASKHDANKVYEYLMALFDLVVDEKINYGEEVLFSEAGFGNALPAIITAHPNNLKLCYELTQFLKGNHPHYLEDLCDDGAVFDAILLLLNNNETHSIELACALIEFVSDYSNKGKEIMKKRKEIMKKRGFVTLLEKLQPTSGFDGVNDTIEILQNSDE